jgi:hypothetical protein
VLHEPPLHRMLVAGAAPSPVTVNPVGVDVRPAPFVADTLGPEGCAAPAAKLYAPAVRVQPMAKLG